MAFRRKTFKRSRKGRKVRRFRAKLKRFGRAPGTNSDRGWFKLRYEQALGASGAGSIQHYISNSNLTAVYNGAGTVQDYSNVSGLYDMYRIHAIGVKFIPTSIADSSSVTNYVPLYIGPDPDSPTSPVTTTSIAIQYERMKVKNLGRPWSYYMKVPKYSNVDTPLGFQEMAAPTDKGIIWLFSSGLTASKAYGHLIITYYVSCVGRR